MPVQIEAWLKSTDKPYSAGVQLLKQYGDGGFLLDVLAMGETSYNRMKLLEALLAIDKAASPNTIPKPELSLSVEDADYAGMPDEVRKLLADIKAGYKLNGNRKGQLEVYRQQAKKIK